MSCEPQTFSLEGRTSLTSKEHDVYAFHVVANDSADPIIAASLSNNVIKLCNLDGLRHISTLKGPTSTIAGIKFSRNNPFLLYSAYENGNISIWDTRENAKNPSKSMQDEGRPILSFDVDINENFICTGTELIQEDAYLLFWDCRSCNLLGGYWDSHIDDITQVKFHPHKKDILASSSVDGLVNVYDVSLPTEDDAIQYTLNADTSLEKITWLSLSSKSKDTISSINHMGGVSLWNIDDAAPYWSYSREEIKNFDKQGDAIVDYAVDTFQFQDTIYVLTGSNNGSCHLWTPHENGMNLCLDLIGGHDDVVRALFWSVELRILLTVGEDGRVCAWKYCDGEYSTSPKSSLKMNSTLKHELMSHQKAKPY